MNRDRLTRLANFLDTLQADEFDYLDIEKCAIGYAIALRNMGLGKLTMDTFVARINGVEPLFAAMRAFDINKNDAIDLFFRRAIGISPKVMAENIRDFMSQN